MNLKHIILKIQTIIWDYEEKNENIFDKPYTDKSEDESQIYVRNILNSQIKQMEDRTACKYS